MKDLPEVCQKLRGQLIVSCQAPEGDTFHGPDAMARFAVAAPWVRSSLEAPRFSILA